MARPRKEAQAARGIRLNLRLTAAERAAVDQAAQAAGQSPSDYARMRVLAVSASSVAATYASPEVWDPVTARENRRKYGRCGAIRVERDIEELLP